MELTKLKNQLVVTKRGHRLLKDKQDEMIRQFMEIVYKTKDLRTDVEKMISQATSLFKKGRAKIRKAELYEITALPALKWEMKASKLSSMSIDSPSLDIRVDDDIHLPYSLNSVPQEFDGALLLGAHFLPRLIKLAQYEKMTESYAREIEKTRRRVNAIEHIMIPELTSMIKDIRTKLADLEMASTIRVMKSKEMILKKNLANKK
jgi:V/A-type H+-transporting ATPase subunit D